MLSSYHRTHRTSSLCLCLLLLQHTLVLVSSTITISQPAASTTWFPGESYDIVVSSDSQDTAVQTWQVDLVVIGGECDGICLHDGVVKEISQGYSLQSTLRFKVPTDLVQHGKVFTKSLLLGPGEFIVFFLTLMLCPSLILDRDSKCSSRMMGRHLFITRRRLRSRRRTRDQRVQPLHL